MLGRRIWRHMLASHVGQMVRGASAWVGGGRWLHHHLRCKGGMGWYSGVRVQVALCPRNWESKKDA